MDIGVILLTPTILKSETVGSVKLAQISHWSREPLKSRFYRNTSITLESTLKVLKLNFLQFNFRGDLRRSVSDLGDGWACREGPLRDQRTVTVQRPHGALTLQPMKRSERKSHAVGMNVKLYAW